MSSASTQLTQLPSFFSALITSTQLMNLNNYARPNFFQAINRLCNYCQEPGHLQRNYLLLGQDIEKSLYHKDKKGFLCLEKYFYDAYPIYIMLGQTQRKSVIASQNLRTPPGNLNQNFCGLVSIVQVKIKDIMEISLDNKDYEKPDTYYHSQIAAASAFLTDNPKLLFNARFIFKQKT